ncbi:MAG: NDP-sugar synthase, partial [Calditrichaceae bacterium]
MHKTTAIILVGNCDFGRCPIASRLRTAFWPIAGKTVLERLLCHLADQGIKQAVICGGDADSLKGIKNLIGNRLALSFFDESLPVGTAGCIREALKDKTEELLIVLPAGIVNPPAIDVLIKAHVDGRSDLTLMLNPCYQDHKYFNDASEIYVCNRDISKYIPEAGYFDIKEGLIPKMLHDGKTIHAATLPHHAGNFRNRQEYLEAVFSLLENSPKLNTDIQPIKSSVSGNVRAAKSAIIDPKARIC